MSYTITWRRPTLTISELQINGDKEDKTSNHVDPSQSLNWTSIDLAKPVWEEEDPDRPNVYKGEQKMFKVNCKCSHGPSLI